MICAASQPGTREYLLQFNRRLAERRIPISGSLELTRGCNLRCAHCYLGPGTAFHRRGAAELTFERWQSIIDEIAAAGCLNLLFTGGEPLLRADFPDLYRQAKKRGFLVSVFTNGTLVTDQTVRIFQEWPPQGVEISLYGATAATYERITGVPGSYGRCVRGIERLLAGGVRVGLKTILMTLNSREFAAIEKMASDWGVKFRFDAGIFPRQSGDRGPLGLRVPVEEAVDLELGVRGRAEAWLRHFEVFSGPPVGDRRYQCGAGVTGFHVDAGGELRPCLMTAKVKYDLRGGSFAAGWQGPLRKLGELRAANSRECLCCERRPLCDYCPGFFEVETGDEEQRSEYLCSLAAQRHQRLRMEQRPGATDAR